MQIIIDEYKREIQKIKMELSEQIEENVRLKGFKKMVLEKPEDFDNDRSFENDTRINLFDEERIEFKTLREENRKLKKRAEEAEGENTIIKGIGNNSPEMRALQARVKELDNSLSSALEINDKYQRENKEAKEINKLHQELNGKLQVELTELKEDNKKLSHQIEDKVNAMRKSGM